MILLATVRSDIKNKSYYIMSSYYKMFHKIDVDIVLISKSDIKTYIKLEDKCDGLLLVGGKDINPIWYKEKKIDTTKLEASEIDEADLELIDIFYNKQRPIIGICRGMQIINVYFGGKINQNISERHVQNKSDIYCHDVNIVKNTMLSKYLSDKIRVNSFHHQSVDKVGKNLIVNAISDDSIIEGIEYKNIIGVQWHPEQVNDFNQNRLLQLFEELLTM